MRSSAVVGFTRGLCVEILESEIVKVFRKYVNVKICLYKSYDSTYLIVAQPGIL